MQLSVDEMSDGTRMGNLLRAVLNTGSDPVVRFIGFFRVWGSKKIFCTSNQPKFLFTSLLSGSVRGTLYYSGKPCL